MPQKCLIKKQPQNILISFAGHGGARAFKSEAANIPLEARQSCTVRPHLTTYTDH